MASLHCPLHSDTIDSSMRTCFCYKKVSPEPPVLRDTFLCACNNRFSAPSDSAPFIVDPFYFVGQPNTDHNPLGRTVVSHCSSIFPELSAQPFIPFPPPQVCSAPTPGGGASLNSKPQCEPSPTPSTSDSYSQTTGAHITPDLRIPVPLVSSECETKPAFLIRRSGPVTTTVHRIPYNSPCSRSRKLYKITAFPTCPSCVRIQAIFAERPPRPSDWNPLLDASSRTLTFFCVHSNGKHQFNINPSTNIKDDFDMSCVDIPYRSFVRKLIDDHDGLFSRSDLDCGDVSRTLGTFSLPCVNPSFTTTIAYTISWGGKDKP